MLSQSIQEEFGRNSILENCRRHNPWAKYQQEEADRFPYADRYLCTEIAERLNELRNADLVKKTSGAEIFRRLQAEGCVTEIIQDGIWRKVISDKGLEHGLFMGIRISKKGTEYEDVYCNERAQKWIVDMMR